MKQQGCRTGSGKAERHFKSSSGLILRPDFACMKLHSSLRDRQPQADSTGGAFSRFVEAKEGTE
jgi:hypothetical protein